MQPAKIAQFGHGCFALNNGCFACNLAFAVLLIILLCIIRRRNGVVKRNDDVFRRITIIVKHLCIFGARRKRVKVCRQQFAEMPKFLKFRFVAYCKVKLFDLAFKPLDSIGNDSFDGRRSPLNAFVFGAGAIEFVRRCSECRKLAAFKPEWAERQQNSPAARKQRNAGHGSRIKKVTVKTRKAIGNGFDCIRMNGARFCFGGASVKKQCCN